MYPSQQFFFLKTFLSYLSGFFTITILLLKMTRLKKIRRKLSSVSEIWWSRGVSVAPAALAAGRYPRRFPLIQSQHQLPIVTHSWFVADFTVAARPASLSMRRLRSGTNGVMCASGDSCCFLPTPHSDPHKHTHFEHTHYRAFSNSWACSSRPLLK